jgi:spore maturation protein CgeB
VGERVSWTYYRGILRALTSYGHEITFFEPDAYDRQSHCDIAPPPWCRVVVYPATEDGLGNVLAQVAAADVVIKATGVGVYDEALLSGVIALACPDAVRIFGTWTPRRPWRTSQRLRITGCAWRCRIWMPC